MINLSMTAEASLYRSSGHYRHRTRGLGPVGREIRATDCFDTCMGECNSDRPTCEFECRHECDQPLPPCPPGQRVCYGYGSSHRTCCPETKSCCVYYDRPSLREILTCCDARQGCCTYGGCYDLATQQCQPSGIWNCPPGRDPCNGLCCPPGEACTLDGCVPRESACLGRRCAPGEVCTPDGCCPPERATPQGCCPRDRALCDGKCCVAGEICINTSAGGFCIKPLA
jgi:hypothetical protein